MILQIFLDVVPKRGTLVVHCGRAANIAYQQPLYKNQDETASRLVDDVRVENRHQNS